MLLELSLTNNSPSQDFNHPNDLFQSRYVSPGFKPFSYPLLDNLKFNPLTSLASGKHFFVSVLWQFFEDKECD